MSPKTSKPKRASRTDDLVVKVIESWEDFLQIVGEPPYRNWAFRGQTDAEWALFPTVARELRNRRVNRRYWAKQEHRIVWIFQRKAFHFLQTTPSVTDTPRWLALIQHHGGPTRLLDFTWSPYVAAFFALESATTDAAVWAINAPRLGTFAYGPHSPPGNRPPSPQQVLRDLGLRGRTGVALGEPYFKDRRVIAQAGTFAFPYDVTQPLDKILARQRGAIAKFILRGPELRRRALRELYRMNITNATLFPDLDGLARSLKFELEYHWQYDPTDPASEARD